jgi:hypothetical protein
MQAEWFYLVDGDEFGPVSESGLKQLAIDGELVSTDLVWKKGFGEWVPAVSIPELPFSDEDQPPAPPRYDNPTGSATTGFILGMVGMIAWFIPLFGLPITVAGLIKSIKGMPSTSRGIAVAGVT